MPIVSPRTKSKIKKRKKERVFRQSRTVLMLIGAAVWGLLISIVLFVDPEANGSAEIFFAVLLVSLTITIELITKNIRRALLVSVACVFFLFLRYVGIGNIFNLLLVIGVAAAFESRFLIRH